MSQFRRPRLTAMQPIASCSRRVLPPCLCRPARRTMTSSVAVSVRKSWFMERERKRRQDADYALDEQLAGRSEFADVEPGTVDLDAVDRATARPSRDGAADGQQPWYLRNSGLNGPAEKATVEDQPWYVKAQYEGIPDEPGRDIDLAPEPPPPAPDHLPQSLHALYDQLVHSLWIDPYTTVWIDAHASSDDGSAHTDWIVVCTVNEKRERAMAGSMAEMKQWVRDMVTTLYPDAGPRPAVYIEGYRRHFPDWMLFDGGSVILHIFSRAARDTWSVEEPYLKGARARSMDEQRGVPHPFFSTQSRGPASNADVSY